MDYYSAIKINELLMHTATWMDFKDIMLCGGKKSHFQKARYCMIQLIQHSQNGKISGVKNILVVAKHWEWWGRRS